MVLVGKKSQAKIDEELGLTPATLST